MLKHNSYFNGQVQSLALVVDGVSATVGVMEPGKYTFSTSSEEHMTITAGVLRPSLWRLGRPSKSKRRAMWRTSVCTGRQDGS